MYRTLAGILVVAALVGVGWAVGHAQYSQGDFEVRVTMTGDTPSVECVRGCFLTWAPSVDPPNGETVNIHVPARVIPDRCRIWGFRSDRFGR